MWTVHQFSRLQYKLDPTPEPSDEDVESEEEEEEDDLFGGGKKDDDPAASKYNAGNILVFFDRSVAVKCYSQQHLIIGYFRSQSAGRQADEGGVGDGAGEMLDILMLHL